MADNPNEIAADREWLVNQIAHTHGQRRKHAASGHTL